MRIGRWGWGLVVFWLLLCAGLAVSVVVMAGAPDPMGQTCEENAAFLPQTIPATLILNVTDENGERVPPDLEPRVRAELSEALGRYAFNASIQLVTNDSTVGAPLGVGSEGVHEAHLQLWFRERLPARVFERVEGRMCGNVILVRETSDSAHNVWSQKHELGHYFGMPHHEGTFMNGRGDRSPAHDLLVSCQENILADWVPGQPYVPHWVRSNAGDCAEQAGLLASLNPFG